MSFTDARTVKNGATLEADVCVVGGGAAGIALAVAFAEHGVDACVIEAGGMHLDVGTQGLYRGRVTGGSLPHNYLVTSRLRQFGGTTNHWGGHTLAINAHAFGPRPGVAGGEWPFPKSALEPYYERAAAFLGSERPYRPEAASPPDAPLIDVANYTIRHLRLAQTYRAMLAESTSVRVVLYGNVVRLEPTAEGERLQSVSVATLGGQRFSVAARVFVLATGAIENARLLLQPTRAHPRGIGNEHDLVGRYFMEHIFVRGMALSTSKQWPRFCALSPELQARHELLELGVHLREPTESVDEITRALVAAVQVLDEPSRDPTVYGLMFYGEAWPNPENRVTLTAERDELGQPRCQLHFELSDVDRRSLHETQMLIARIAGEREWGRLRPVPMPRQVGLGNHHIGTTRMNPDPRRGVVDAQCRVHGLSNLFIAGSSVFPSAGLANPTFTILALAYRLADHLIQGIRQRAFG